MKNNANYYVDNQKFYDEIVKYTHKCDEAKAAGIIIPRLTPYLGKCIQDIAIRTSYSREFINYSFREEMIGDAIETCLKYFDRYDIEEPRRNPFGYFTMVIWRAFVSRIGEEEKSRYIKYKNFEHTIIHGGMGELLVDDENHLLSGQIYDNINLFIQNYEAKQERKRLNRLEKKRLKDIENAKNTETLITSVSTDNS